MSDEFTDEPVQAEDLGGPEAPPDPAQTQNPVDPRLDLPDDAVNLVPYLLQKAKEDPKVEDYVKKVLPKQIVDHFNEDWEARKPWMDKRKERLALYLGDLKEKHEPFRNCANMHVPILSTRILRLATRVYAEIFKDGQPLFAVQVSSTMERDRADFLTKHENWQFRSEIPEFQRHVFRALVEFFRDGDCVFDSYRDLEKGVNRHEHLSPDEFVYPYTRKSAATDMSDVPRKTKVLFPYRRDLEKMETMGFYAQVDLVTEAEDGSHETEHQQVIKDAADKYEGKDRNEHVADAPYYLFEYHGWSKLPYQEEEIPIRAVLHPKSGTLLGLYSRYYDDPEDSRRFQQQSAEHDQYVAAIGQYQQAMQKEQELLSRIQQPDVHPQDSMAIAQQVQTDRPPPPVPPEWMKSEDGQPVPPEPCKQKIIERFSHGVCIENPDGSMGIGIGMLLMPHQKAAQILLNQFIDQATLANSDRGIIHTNLKLDPGVKSIEPGTFERVQGVPPDQLEKAIVRFPTSQANTQLLNGLQLQMQDADAISSAPDVLSGEKEGDETYRGQATRVEQAVKQLSVYGANFLMCMDQVAKNNALLNFMYETDEHLKDVLDPATQQMTQIKIGREMYRGGFGIVFSADLSFSSKASRIAESDDALGMATKGIPAPLLSLVAKPTFIAQLVRNCLKARGLNEMLAYINTDDEIDAKIAQQSAMPPTGSTPPGGPPHPGMPPQMPHPSAPTGKPTATPGAVPPQSRLPVGTPAAAAPSQ